MGEKATRARSYESVLKTRWNEINKLLRTEAVKDWKLTEAKATGAKILPGVWVDPEDKEKSRYCTRGFNTYRDPSVSATACDEEAMAIIDLIAVKKTTRRFSSMRYRPFHKHLRRNLFSEVRLPSTRRRFPMRQVRRLFGKV